MLDVADPDHPVIAGDVHRPGWSGSVPWRSVTAIGDRAYVSSWDGVTEVDIGDRPRPRIRSHIDQPPARHLANDGRNVFGSVGRVVLLRTGWRGLRQVAESGDLHGGPLVVQADHVYLAEGDHGVALVQIVDGRSAALRR